MALFKKTIQDIGELFQKRDYWGLIKSLQNKDPSIVKKVEKALCELAIDKEAIKERAEWIECHFHTHDILLKKLESPKLLSHKEELNPLINVLRKESEVIKGLIAEKKKTDNEELNKLNKRLEELKIPSISDKEFMQTLVRGLKPNEIIEFGQKLHDYKGWVLYGHDAILVTNFRIIYYKYYSNHVIMPIDYDSISLKHGLTNIKLISGKTFITLKKSWKQLISHLENHIPELKETT